MHCSRFRYKDQCVAASGLHHVPGVTQQLSMNANLHLVRQPKNRNTRGPFYVIVATLSHMYMTAPRRPLLQNVQGCRDIEWSSPRSMHAPLSSSSAMALYPPSYRLSISDHLHRRSMFESLVGITTGRDRSPSGP